MTNEYVDLVSGEIIKGSTTSSKSDSQHITISDAQSEIGKILVREFGSDLEYKSKGAVDTRRFSNYSKVDVYWQMFFENIPDTMGGRYSKKICEDFRNLNYSVGGGHKKNVIHFQDSLSGSKDKKDKVRDSRSWVQKHITQRGKEPEE